MFLARKITAITLALGLTLIGTPCVDGASPSAEFRHLIGSWAVPDGTYTLVIEHVDRQGRIVASCLSGRSVTTAEASARKWEGKIELEIHLRRKGQSGRTYRLRYDPATDRLIGTTSHNVFRQEYNIFFVRQ